MRIYALLLLAFIMSFCGKNKEPVNKLYLTLKIEALKQTFTGHCYKNVIILPGTGCSGCITIGEDFFVRNYNNKEYLFILTNIKSIKILNNKVGTDIKKISNVVLDYDNIYSHHDFSKIYPTIIFFDCKKFEVIEVLYQKPGNNVFNNL